MRNLNSFKKQIFRKKIVMNKIFRRFFSKKALRAGLFSLLAVAFSFCVPACSYSLGNRGALPFETIEILPIENEVDLPQAQAMLARDISDTLNREPNLQTVVEKGQAALKVVISDYRRSISATSSRDSTLASTQALTLVLRCSLMDARTGKYYFRDRALSVSTNVYTGTSPGLGETQSFPVLSREAAKKVRDMVASVW